MWEYLWVTDPSNWWLWEVSICDQKACFKGLEAGWNYRFFRTKRTRELNVRTAVSWTSSTLKWCFPERTAFRMSCWVFLWFGGSFGRRHLLSQRSGGELTGCPVPCVLFIGFFISLIFSWNTGSPYLGLIWGIACSMKSLLCFNASWSWAVHCLLGTSYRSS